MSKIIVATDLSEQGALAVECGAAWAEDLKKDLEILNVLNLYPNDYTLPEDFNMEKLKTEITLNQEKELENKFDQLNLTETEFRVELGEPEEVIRAEMDKKGNELLIVGGKGRSALRNLIIGSTAHKLIRHANSPVLVVKDRRAFHPKSIFVSVDSKGTSENALNYAATIAKMENAKLYFFHAVDSETVQTMLESDPGVLAKAQSMDDLLRFAKDWANEKIAPHLFKLKDNGLNVEFEAEISKDTYPVKSILAQAEKIQPDILVTGTHGKTLRDSLSFVGSVAEILVQKYEGSMLVFKGKEEEQENFIHFK